MTASMMIRTEKQAHGFADLTVVLYGPDLIVGEAAFCENVGGRLPARYRIVGAIHSVDKAESPHRSLRRMSAAIRVALRLMQEQFDVPVHLQFARKRPRLNVKESPELWNGKFGIQQFSDGVRWALVIHVEHPEAVTHPFRCRIKETLRCPAGLLGKLFDLGVKSLQKYIYFTHQFSK